MHPGTGERGTSQRLREGVSASDPVSYHRAMDAGRNQTSATCVAIVVMAQKVALDPGDITPACGAVAPVLNRIPPSVSHPSSLGVFRPRRIGFRVARRTVASCVQPSVSRWRRTRQPAAKGSAVPIDVVDQEKAADAPAMTPWFASCTRAWRDRLAASCAGSMGTVNRVVAGSGWP